MYIVHNSTEVFFVVFISNAFTYAYLLTIINYTYMYEHQIKRNPLLDNPTVVVLFLFKIHVLHINLFNFVILKTLFS